MLNRIHMMMDLETLGLSTRAPISQIGACYFDIATGEVKGTMEVNVNLRSYEQSPIGFHPDPSTVLWWLQQPRAARNSVFNQFLSEEVTRAINHLSEFMYGADVVWSHSSFDAAILSEYARRLNVRLPVAYRDFLDVRTLVRVSGLDLSTISPVGVSHTALSDCIYQAKCVAAAKALLSLTN